MDKHFTTVKDNFNQLAQDYDILIPKLVPGYFELKRSILDAIKKLNLAKSNILDIGCGTAILGEDILGANKNYCYYGVDLSEQMVNIAKARLESFNGRMEIFCADALKIKSLKLPKIDIIVSVLALHHFDNKRLIYKTIYDFASLNNSFFILGDLVVDPFRDKPVYDFRVKHMKDLGMTEKEINEWFMVWKEEDKPSTIKENTDLLKEIGFKPKLIWQNQSYASFICEL